MAEDIIRREENVDVEGIGSRISDDIGQIISDEKYGSKIVSTVSRQLTERFGKGYQRMNWGTGTCSATIGVG